MSETSPRAIVERFCALYDDGTPDSYGSDGFTALWSDDVVVEYGASAQFPQGRRLEGKPRMLAELERLGGWLRNRHMVLRQMSVDGETVGIAWSFWVTAAADMPGIKAGSRLRMDGADFMTVRDGLVVYDRQLSGPMVPSVDDEEL